MPKAKRTKAPRPAPYTLNDRFRQNARARQSQRSVPLASAAFPSVRSTISTAPDGAIVVRGYERLPSAGTNAVTSFAALGQVINTVELAPQTWHDSWLGRFASLYERFKFESAAVHLIPNAPATTQGSVLICFDTDAWDDPPENIIQASAYQGARVVPLWQSARIPLPLKSGQDQAYYTDPIDGTESSYKFNVQGSLYTLWNSVPGSLPVSNHTVFLEYTIKFYIKCLDPIPSNVAVSLDSETDSSGHIKLAPIAVADLNAAKVPLAGTTGNRTGYASVAFSSGSAVDRLNHFGLDPGRPYAVTLHETTANNFTATVASNLLDAIGGAYLTTHADVGTAGMVINLAKAYI